MTFINEAASLVHARSVGVLPAALTLVDSNHPILMFADQPAIREDRLMLPLMKMLKRLLGTASLPESTEMRSVVIMQRKAHRFTEGELQAAGERGWEKKFDGKADPMYFVSADQAALTVVKAGPHVMRVTSFPCRYADDDEYALSQLSQPEQKKAWNEHQAHTLLDLFNDLSRAEKRIPDADAYASLAKLALHLGDPNCTAVFVPDKNIMMPNDGTAEEGLRLLINKNLF